MATKKRKGVRAKAETPEVKETTPEVETATPEVEKATPEVEVAPQAEEVSLVELGTISVPPRVHEFLARICKDGSVEQAAAEILTTWADIYEHEEDGGIEHAFTEAEPPEPEDPEFQEAFEERART
jgi:hypothetical protein